MSDTQPVRIQIRLSRERVSRGLILLAGVISLLLAGTFVYVEWIGPAWPADSTAARLLRHINLAFENVTAAWCSSMLLLTAAVMAAVCYFADAAAAPDSASPVIARAQSTWLTRAWLLVAVMFAGLSLDEVGSMHERIGSSSMLNFVTHVDVGWVLLLAPVIAAVGLALLAFAFLRVRRSPLAFGLFVVGVALFLTVPILEHIQNKFQHAALLDPTFRRPVVQVLSEEGSEVLGAFCFVAAMSVYALGAGPRAGRTGDAASTIVISARPRAAWATAIVIAVLGYPAMLLTEYAALNLKSVDTGIPNNWFPSALAAVAAVLCLLAADECRQREERAARLYWIVALFALGVSAYYGAHWRGWLNALDNEGYALSWTANGVIGFIAVVLSVALARLADNVAVRGLSFVWAPALALALSGWQWRDDAGGLDYVACCVLALATLGHLLQCSADET